MRLLKLLAVMMILALAVAACGGAAPEPAAPAGDSGATEEEAAAPAEPASEEPAAAASSDGPRTICFAYQDLETEFWVAGHKAIVETLNGLGVEVIERNANEDANRQLEQVKDCIAQGVDGIIIIPQDGESAVTIVGEANKAGIPIGVFNRPPANDSNPTLVIVADNEAITQKAVEHMAEEAKKLGRKVTPLIMVGDLGDPNAVGRRQGFYNVIEANPDLFNEVIEVPTKWDGATALANLEAAMQANPEVDFLFTSSDFMYPMIQSVLEPMGKWTTVGDPNHVIMGGLDGDSTACRLMREGFVDATGVQDLFFEAEAIMGAMLDAIDAGETTPENWMDDPGFALTQANWEERAYDMWGCKLVVDDSGEELERTFDTSAISMAPAAPALAPVAEGATVCFAYQDLETEFWVAGHKAIVETLNGLGVEVIERNANEDANRQLEQVKDCIAQGVDGIIIIPQDGESAVTIVGEANKAGIPIGVFNRPPANDSNPTLVIVADNEAITQKAVEHMAEEAKKLGRKVTPLIMVGDLGDPNAVGRRQGFYNVIEANPDLFNEVIEVPTKWDGATALANLEAAMQANPEVDFLFTSSDFMYPMIQSVLEPMGKWTTVGDPNHVIMGGLDGDSTACRLMREGFVDATGVQDLFFEAETIMGAMLEAIAAGETTPENWMDDPGFALTQANWEERAYDMWGCKLVVDDSGEELERTFQP